MADLFQIGLSGIYSSQASLATTSHNISNVSTEGYSRQTVDVTSAQAQKLGTNFIGNGSIINGIDRAYDQFAFKENIINTSAHAYNEVSYTQASQLDKLLSNESTSVTKSVLSLFSALGDVADHPNTIETRSVFLEDASNMINQYNTLYQQLETQYSGVNNDIENSAAAITELADNIATLNGRILAVSGSNSGGDANDLLDRRNQAITALSEYVNVSVLEADNDMVNIFIGSGQGLVMGVHSQSIVAVNGDPDPARKELALSHKGKTSQVDGSKFGGKVSALFEARENEIERAFNQLGQNVIGLTHAINEQQKQGQTLDGEIGAALFNDINSDQAMKSRVLSHADGKGEATLSVRIDDLSELSADEFTLIVDSYDTGTGDITFEVTNNTTGAKETIIGNSSTGQRIEIPGAGISIGIDSISTSDPLQAGKEFTLRPTRLGAQQASLDETDPTKVAVADAEIKAVVSDTNTGTATFHVSDIVDKGDTNYMDEDSPVTIKISVNTTTSQVAYNIFDKNDNQINNTELTAPINALTGKATLEFGGVKVEMEKGIAVAGDEITLNYNETGEGDNRNILAMSDLQNTKIMNDGKSTFQDVYSEMISEIGAKTANADVAMQSSAILKNQSFERIQSVSGVNMDEEAANLLMYQQHYSAAARVITIASELFDTILQAAR
ncbi:flagellar hook-associated protein FlgK [Psychromonas sp. SR45-3]|uniref:flagellar hook-associated protein FlgK n=1 Tax=Psychromonas sp. SR45-3 TaxID=2760930 RepID=UPI0015F7B385|nr:flagellar hook-associated protein FlgK [Psychromonas sp. SR45-3]MBB1274290.1 flagellar hook-associated protein FlgK [Psychromonas sp. SR45-3]